MIRALLLVLISFTLSSCAQNSPAARDKQADTIATLPKDQKMDTTFFWIIMDNAFSKAEFDNKLKKQAILDQLIKLTPEQIREFEIIFQQMNLKANAWNNMAAQTIIYGGSGDDSFFYFRCWLISLGKYNFEETLKNPDHLATLDIPVNKKWGYGEAMFEELIGISDHAYSIVTGKQEEDDTFPRTYAMKKGLFYDSSGETKGKEWQEKDLPKIAPGLFKKFSNK